MGWIEELTNKRMPKRFGFDHVEDIQVLTSMHRGVVGALNLNTELQKVRDPGQTVSSGKQHREVVRLLT
jgi:exodeoxyribonuclease V alpha subunit